MSIPEQRSEIAADHLNADVERRAVRGGVVMMSAQSIRFAMQLGSIFILTRLLTPVSFGLLAMVGAIVALFDVAKDLGLSAGTIQRPNITHLQISALFWINTAAGLIAGAVLIAAAPLIAHFYGQPSLIPITRWLALGFVMNGITVQHWALLRRQMRFREIAALEAGAEILALIIAIVCARMGAQYWALVVQRLTGPALVMIGCWTLCRWRPLRPQRTEGVGELLRLGFSVMACSAIATVARGFDLILVGRLFGPVVEGLYERATRIVMVPLNNINIPLYTVALPALSRIADQELRFRSAFRALVSHVAMITMPAAALVIVTGDWLTELMFGSNWIGMAPLISSFAIAATYQPILLTINLIYLPQNRTREMVRATAVDVGLSILSFVVGVPFGALGVALSYALLGLVIRLPVGIWLATRRGPVRVADLGTAILPSLVAAVAVVVIVYTARIAIVPVLVRAPFSNLVGAFAAALAIALVTYFVIPPSRRILASGFHSLTRIRARA